MLSQLLFVRLKAAENALKQGRLDEAYRLALAPDVREHRRGAAVLGALTEQFLKRARNHFQDDRFTEALVDLDRAETGGAMKEKIVELREQVRTVEAEQNRKAQSRRERLQAARRRIEHGSLVAGRRMLDEVSQGDRAAQQLRNQADEKLADVDHAVKFIEDLIAQGQLSQAAERIRRAKSADAYSADVTRIETNLCARVLQNVKSAIIEGRIGRAEDELACLGSLGDNLPEKQEAADMLGLAKQAGTNMRAHRYMEARRDAMSLQRLLPKAGWLKQVVGRLRDLDDVLTELTAGPLGESLADDKVDLEVAAGRPAAKPFSPDDTVALPHRVSPKSGMPDRILMLINGGGSYLIIRGDNASIGRAAAAHPADMAIYSDLNERHANVSRVDEDYFLFSAKEIEIGGRKAKHQLLKDSDRIVLGRKAKMTFRLPSRKSPTAVFDLSDTTKMPNDVRRIVMFSRQATIGQGPTAHIQCRHASLPLILFERGGALWIRPKSDGHVDNEARQLIMGETMEIAGASLVVQPWTIRTPGRTA
ncbi:MAG: hypothetical protein IIC51_04815 [Planctomycetes bacterium]|nr:hypothetical protein [Planctomycetota bacterium]